MVQTEAQKRAKAKYYAKLRESEEYKANMAQEAEIITRSQRTKKNTVRQLKNTIQPIKKRLINI